METLPIFSVKILHILAGSYGMSCTLEDLTYRLAPLFDFSAPFKEVRALEKELQARILDALIILNDDGHIFLNSGSDKSYITIKGLIVLNNKVFCN